MNFKKTEPKLIRKSPVKAYPVNQFIKPDQIPIIDPPRNPRIVHSPLQTRGQRQRQQILNYYYPASRNWHRDTSAPPAMPAPPQEENPIPPADPALAEATGVPAASGDSINPGYSYIKRPIDYKKNVVVYNNAIMCNTWGYAYNVLAQDKPYGQCMTPLACIPANMVSLYMSPAEFEKLPSGAKAISCRVTVTPKGFRTSFATQQQGSTYSNSNHTLFGLHAIGLNKNEFGRHYEITGRNATKPMLVTQTKPTVAESFQKIMWGKLVGPGCDRAGFYKELPMCLGVHRSLPYYWNLHAYTPLTTNGANVSSVNTGWPLLRESVTEWDFAGHVNIPVLHYEYKFNHGLLKRRQGVMPRNSNNDKSYTYGGNNIATSTTMEVGTDGKLININYNPYNRSEQDPDDYTYNIEKPFLGGFAHSPQFNQLQPLPYIGIQPIPANTPAADNDFTNVQAVWLIETELVVEVYQQTEFARSLKLHPWKAQNYGSEIHEGVEVLNDENITGRYCMETPTTLQDQNKVSFEDIQNQVSRSISKIAEMEEKIRQQQKKDTKIVKAIEVVQRGRKRSTHYGSGTKAQQDEAARMDVTDIKSVDKLLEDLQTDDEVIDELTLLDELEKEKEAKKQKL